LEFQGVMSFNNGSPATFAGNPANEASNFRETNLFVGSAVNSNRNILVSNNYVYHKWDTMVDMATMGFGYISGGSDLTVTNNYIAGGRQALRMSGFSNARFTGNTVFGSLSTVYMDTPAPSSFTWDNNTYFDDTAIDNTGGQYSFQFNKATNQWGGGVLAYDEAASSMGQGWRQWTGYDGSSSYSAGKPTGLRIFVRPNAWEQGRAHVAIFNWGQASTVSINLSSSGLLDGDPFEIRDVQSYFGAPVYTGTYSSGSPSVSVPVGSLSTVEPPIGLGFTPAHTAPEFAVLVVKKR